MAFETCSSTMRFGAASLLLLSLAALPGCSSSGPASVSHAGVDADDAAAKAIELCDADSDGAIDQGEAEAKCPPLAGAMASFDGDSDGKITSSELTAHLSAVADSGTALTGMSCTVYLAGRPLSGATVKLRPVEMYGGALLPAEGVTDDQGLARPSIGKENLPDELAAAELLYPGLYHVEISHPTTQLPAEYNTATELGFEVNPLSREGTSVRFDLKAK